MFCFHHFGKVESDGFQYCKKCGKAVAPECPHIWEKTNEYQITHFGNTNGIIMVLTCKRCGEVKEKKINAS